MATEEYLNKFIANGKRYQELPDRFRQTVTEDDWKRRCGACCAERAPLPGSARPNAGCCAALLP